MEIDVFLPQIMRRLDDVPNEGIASGPGPGASFVLENLPAPAPESAIKLNGSDYSLASALNACSLA